MGLRIPKFKIIDAITEKPDKYIIGTLIFVKRDRVVYKIMPSKTGKYWESFLDISSKRINELLFGLKNRIRYLLRLPIIVNNLTNLPFYKTVRNGTKAKVGAHNYKLHWDKWLILDPIYKNYRDIKASDVSNSVSYTSDEIRQQLKKMKIMMRNIPWGE